MHKNNIKQSMLLVRIYRSRMNMMRYQYGAIFVISLKLEHYEELLS